MSRLNGSGFTMLEMLLSFATFCLLVSFLPISFKLILDQKAIDARLQNMEWKVFINQLKKEVHNSDNIQVVSGKLLLTVNGENIVFEKYGSSIRRVVDFRGNEIVLQQVEENTFEPVVNGVQIKVMDKYGQEHIAVIHAFIEVGNSS